jgi:ABC-type transporter Mla subunit MlaD
MRRLLTILLVCVAAVALVVVATGADESDDAYEVRAIFDNAAFLSEGMEVRVAGAKVGSVVDLDVTFPTEPAREDGSPEPGKAAVVMRIDDESFQDFREDASCTIHPQSLLGEKFVECRLTEPRAAGTEPPPELEVIAEGQRGEGQRLLPLERNGKSVDLDLVNNIMREPYPERFRLILNDLGAGLAARGEELAEVIERSNPALRETNRVLGILARQNRSLARLASDSDAIMSALARERERVASFINEATTVGEATAARRAELEETFARFPGFLRELRSTMTELTAFSDQARPVFGDLGAAAPSLTRAAKALDPFASAGTRALTTLGDAAEEAGPPLRASDPVLRQTRDLAQQSAPATRELGLVLSTLRRTGGYEGFLKTIFGLGGTANAYDSFGHFARALIPVNVCFDYTSRPQAGCSAQFATAPSGRATRALAEMMRQPIDVGRRGKRAPGGERERFAVPGRDAAQSPEAPVVGEGAADDAPAASARAMRDLLDFVIGSRDAQREERG